MSVTLCVFLYELSFCLNIWTLSVYLIKMYVTINNGHAYIHYVFTCLSFEYHLCDCVLTV